MSERKLIALDLDGTLLDKRGNISNKTEKYFNELKAKGHIMAIASGRVLKTAYPAIKDSGFIKYVIASHGSTIYNFEDNEVVYNNLIDLKIAKAILEKNEDIKFLQYSDSKMHHRFVLDGNEKYKDDPLIKVYDCYEDFINCCNEVARITIVLNDRSKSEQFCLKLRKMFEKLDVFVMFDSFAPDKKWIEIINKGVSKYNSIKKIADIEDISYDNIISFGDSTNDIDMIKRSKVGVAMENAIDDVKKEADYIALHHDKDGVIKFLKEYLN